MRRQHMLIRFQIIALLLAITPALEILAQNPADPVQEINDQPLDTTVDLLRGFNSAELARVCLLYTSPSPRD